MTIYTHNYTAEAVERATVMKTGKGRGKLMMKLALEMMHRGHEDVELACATAALLMYYEDKSKRHLFDLVHEMLHQLIPNAFLREALEDMEDDEDAASDSVADALTATKKLLEVDGILIGHHRDANGKENFTNEDLPQELKDFLENVANMVDDDE